MQLSRSFTLLGLCFCGLGAALGQSLGIPSTTGANIDGEIQNLEWQPASRVPIFQANGDTTWVLLQHDQQNLYVAFYGRLESGQVVFPEILIDVNNPQSLAWEPDDWWFHVSATDCDYQGAYGNFDSCSVQRPTWQAVPNFSAGAPNTDTVEIKIPFSKINYSFSPFDTLGLSLMVSNTVNVFDTWPATANRQMPSTWEKVIMFPWLSLEEKSHSGYDFYPNPASDFLELTYRAAQGQVHVQIYDLYGHLLKQQQVLLAVAGSQRISLDLPAGSYLMVLSSDQGRESHILRVR